MILDDLFGTILDGLFHPFGGGGRRQRRLAEKGERLSGVIDGIAVKGGGDEKHFLSVRVQGPAGEFRKTVRQQVHERGEFSRLGAQVPVLHRKGQILVDFPGGAVAAGRTRRKPLEPGIRDDRLDNKRLRTGTRVTAQLLDLEDVEIMGMATQNKHLLLALPGGSTVRVKRAFVPVYASHLAVPGAHLPVALDAKKPEKVSVDWPAAAEADAGMAR